MVRARNLVTHHILSSLVRWNAAKRNETLLACDIRVEEHAELRVFDHALLK